MSTINDPGNFPDEKYRQRLIDHLAEKVNKHQTTIEKLSMHSSAAMNWIGDYLTDPHVRWEKKSVPIDDLYLTGTNPRWNPIILERAERSAEKLRVLMKDDSNINDLFTEAVFSPDPILIRYEDNRYKILDGMHRVIAAIRDDRNSVDAYVAFLDQRKPAPQCEAHVIYDLLRAYHRGLNHDRQGLITALLYLKKSYSNVEKLLRERFHKQWVPNDEVQKIIQEVLETKK